MSEEQEKNSIREEFEAHLNSPLTLLTRIRNLIFGVQTPDLYTRFSFFLALIGWFIFFIWAVMGTIAIRMRDLIFDKKEINVTSLIEERGIALGFEPQSFIGRLEAFHALSVIFWLVAFLGLILLWRKNERFIYFYFGGAGAYLLFMWIMLGFGYYAHDTTFFDKIAFFVMVGHTAMYAYFLKREKSGNKIHMFGIDDQDEE